MSHFPEGKRYSTIMSSFYFTIIGTRDNPLYELEFSSFKNPTSNSLPGEPHFSPKVKELLPFISNASLDIVDDNQWQNNNFNLGRIDHFYGILVNAFVTQGNIRFILCLDSSSSSGHPLDSMMSLVSSRLDEISVKNFFYEVFDLYVKALLNPFYSVNDPLVSPDFDYRVKTLAKRYL